MLLWWIATAAVTLGLSPSATLNDGTKMPFVSLGGGYNKNQTEESVAEVSTALSSTNTTFPSWLRSRLRFHGCQPYTTECTAGCEPLLVTRALIVLSSFLHFPLSFPRKAIQAGFRSIDTAYVYLDEGAVGAGIARAIKTGAVARDDLYVITKIPSCQEVCL